jgi:hypothetical protein
MVRSVIWAVIIGLFVVGTCGRITAATQSSSENSTKQPVAKDQPSPGAPVSPGSQDKKSELDAIGEVAKEAIEAARHSTDATKDFYQWGSVLIVGAAGVISLIGGLYI